MLFNLSISAIKDFVSLVKDEKSFFDRNSNERKNLIEKKFSSNFPAVLSDYLANVDADNFLTDIKNTVLFIKGSAKVSGNKFIDAMCLFVSEDFAFILDKVDSEFFFKKPEYRKEFLDQLLSGNSYFLHELEDLILFSTYQDLNEMAQITLSQIKDSELIIVESAVEIEESSKNEIRKYFIKEKTFSFVEFRVSKGIIGGVRVFVNGNLVDLSWMGKLRGLSRIKA